jgi:2-polyprenyl-3-methyl-5-hydroxy-6-metoxy-1,4-benzoquinol methylase
MGKYETEKKACDICGGTSVKELYRSKKDGTAPVIEDGNVIHQNIDVMCMDCGLIYKYPSLTKKSLDKFYLEDYSKVFRPGWDETISRAMVVYTLDSAIRALDWLKSKVSVKDMTVLDVGAGDGMFMKVLEGEGAKVVGIDTDARSVEIAWKLLGTEVYHGDFMEDPGITGVFDVVVLRNTLEHMYSPTQAIEKAKDLLADDGFMLIEVPSAGRPYPACGINSFLSGAHNYTFTVESLYELTKKCGLSIQALDYAGHRDCMLAIVSKTKSNITVPNEPEKLFTLLQERYKEHNKTFFGIREIILELLGMSNVNNSIGEISKYKHTSNLIVYMILTSTMGNPEKRELCAEIFDTYKWDPTQASDQNCCEATFEYMKGMFYRELGDFTMSKQFLAKANELYPDVLSRNLVKELILEGVLSESVFGDYIWYACYKQSKNL